MNAREPGDGQAQVRRHHEEPASSAPTRTAGRARARDQAPHRQAERPDHRDPEHPADDEPGDGIPEGRREHAPGAAATGANPSTSADHRGDGPPRALAPSSVRRTSALVLPESWAPSTAVAGCAPAGSAPPAARRPVASTATSPPLPGPAELAQHAAVDDGGSMDADEARRVEPGLERSHRLAVQVRPRTHVQLDVVVGRLDPVDLLGLEEDDSPPVAHHDAGGRQRSPARPPPPWPGAARRAVPPPRATAAPSPGPASRGTVSPRTA